MRRPSLLPVVLFLLGLALLGGPPARAADADEAPEATKVIVRLQESLASALAVALAPAWSDAEAPRPVLLVVDVTPNTARAGETLRDAIRGLPPEAGRVPSWQVGPLGGRLTPPVAKREDLASAIGWVLREETPARSTMEALDRSLRATKADRLVVAYLADWRFEDDADLEKTIAGWRRRKVTLSVVGSEAAFGRAWNDGFVPLVDRRYDSLRGGGAGPHYPGIGRSPFASRQHAEPWHGGEASHPHRPYRWVNLFWRSEFSSTDWQLANLDGRDHDDGAPLLPEDLEGRLPPGLLPPRPWNDPDDDDGEDDGEAPRPPDRPPPPPEPPDMRSYPLPSSFGPYALMRAAGMTGGRYVLWSWNPSGRKTVRYEYARCNLFPPDLRDRREIQAEVGGNRHARACLDAWHALVQAGVVEHLPPLRQDLRSPQSIDEVPGATYLPWAWHDRGDRTALLQGAEKIIERLDPILARLDEAIRKAGEAPAGPDRRHEADALYLRHVVRVARFEAGEMLAAGHAVPREAWKGRDTLPGIAPHTWIRQGRDPERVRTTEHLVPYDAERGQAVLEERRGLLARFQGTPFGEELALNAVSTFRPDDWVPGPPPTGSRSPSQSTDDPTPTPRAPGGGSDGGGPTTGD